MSLSSADIQQLWATPLLHTNLLSTGVLSATLHQALSEYCTESAKSIVQKTDNLVSQKTAYTRYNTALFEDESNQTLQQVKQLFIGLCDEYIRCQLDGALPEHRKQSVLWFVVQRPNEADDALYAHYHEGSDIAFVYYLRVPDDKSGRLVFTDPRGVVGRGGFALPRHQFTKIVSPAEGDFMVFPRYLVHYTTANTDVRARQVIAGSIKYEPLK